MNCKRRTILVYIKSLIFPKIYSVREGFRDMAEIARRFLELLLDDLNSDLAVHALVKVLVDI